MHHLHSLMIENILFCNTKMYYAYCRVNLDFLDLHRDSHSPDDHHHHHDKKKKKKKKKDEKDREKEKWECWICSDWSRLWSRSVHKARLKIGLHTDAFCKDLNAIKSLNRTFTGWVLFCFTDTIFNQHFGVLQHSHILPPSAWLAGFFFFFFNDNLESQTGVS